MKIDYEKLMERLRSRIGYWNLGPDPLCIEASAALLSLREENARLREAFLRRVQIDNGCIGTHGGWLKKMRASDTPPCDGGKWDTIKCGCAAEARAALTPTQTQEEPSHG